MTAFNYPRSRATAERLIEKFGQAVTIERTANTGTDYNPMQTITAHNCTVAVMDYANSEVDGTLVWRGDKKIYVSTFGLAIEPSVADKLVIASIKHSIVRVIPLSPAGTVVFYEIQARR